MVMILATYFKSCELDPIPGHLVRGCIGIVLLTYYNQHCKYALGFCVHFSGTKEAMLKVGYLQNVVDMTWLVNSV